MFATETELSPDAASIPKVRFGFLLAGLPAIAAAGAMAFALSAGAALPLTESYKREAVRLWGQKDFSGAMVCFERLAELEPSKPEHRYYQMLILERLGRVDKAESIARTIAPEDQTGLPLAHFWLAAHMLRDPARVANRATVIEGHLLRFRQAMPDSPEGKALLARLYASTGRPGEARPLLEAVTKNQPDLLMGLARVCKALGDDKEAAVRARAALEAAKAKSEARPDDKAARFYWADACAFLEDYSEAIRVLQQGEKLTKDPLYNRLIADACASWAASLGRGGKSTPAERLSVLQTGLKYDDANVRLLEQVAGLMTQGDGKESDALREKMRLALVSGRAPALAHFALGNDAWVRNKPEEARTHWEQAYRINPKLAVVANNLAWLLAYHEPVDLPRARTMIEEALGQLPDTPQLAVMCAKLRGTRGQVMLKQGLWKQAIPEMEYALANGEDSPTLHDSLASSYDHIGMADMAAEHRKLLKK